MGKRETKQSYNDTREQRTQSQARYNEQIQGSQQEQQRNLGNMGMGRANLESSYTNLMDPNSFQGISYSPVSASTGNLTETLGRAREFADTGGYTPEREASIMGNINSVKDLAGTEGVSEENIARMRGMGGFDEFAQTGGYTDKDIANIKAQAISPIGSFATGTRDELNRRRAVQGGYGPGFDAANRQLQRDAARGIVEASLGANIGIKEKVNEGRKWGIGGLAGAESNVVSAKLADLTRKMQGFQSAADTEMQLQNSISGYRAQGLSIEQATARAIDDLESQANFVNAQNEMQANMYNNQMENNRYMAGIGGFENLYGSDVNQYEAERGREVGLFGNAEGNNLNYLQNQSQLGMQPGVGGNILGAVGTAAGIGSQFFMPRTGSYNPGRNINL